MYSHQLLIVALVASVSANIAVPGHLPMRRSLQDLARRTDSAHTPSATDYDDGDDGDDGNDGNDADDQCEIALMSIAASLPTPAPALESYEETHEATDPCYYSVPSSLSSDYDSYTSSVYSWYSASSAALASILSTCPEYADDTSEALCSTAMVAAATSTSGASATATTTGTASSHSSMETHSSSSSSGSSSGSSSTTASSGSSTSAAAFGSGASAREIGIVGAVLAGVLGVAVAL
ncbi:hypothetical protein VSDG_00473 [Cytospora chrysosperma]|uniref:Infection structure specific protein n=1 Tax=Cytospora chrysosperma TaxID=252740 RepID=A0A423WNY0_CYTCH|nr:hypothetical protein VSDG_00473 [Valsa sordida]